jgi:tetratricopeptide (TPR) repeat protein
VPRSIRSTCNLRRIWVCGVLVASFLACGESHLYACLWLYGTDPEGHSKTFNGGKVDDVDQLVYEAHHPPLNREHWARNLDWLETKAKLKDYKQQNDFAVNLLRAGEAQRAIDILKSIEDKRPGEYATAANLGTAYELAGENDLALKWIKEAIHRNPGSHEGTEWVHVRILEAKLKLEKDPKWLQEHGVLALDFGPELIPHAPPAVVDDLGNKHDPKDVEAAIRHQLHERIPLVPPPDPIVGDLLADLGTLIVLDGIIEHALPVYDLALEYHMPRRELPLNRIEHFKQLVAANPDSLQRSSSENARSNHDTEGAILVAIAIGVIALLFVLLALAYLGRPRASQPPGASSAGPTGE